MKISHQFCKKLVEEFSNPDSQYTLKSIREEFGGKKIQSKDTPLVVIVFPDNSCAQYLKEEFRRTGKIKALDVAPEEILDLLNKDQANGND